MSRNDFYHEHVRAALVAAGWTITNDPLNIPFFGSRIMIDLAAERVEADSSKRIIAVEVKNFRQRKDYVNEFEKALGQYILYQEVLDKSQFLHTLYLAIPETAFIGFFQDSIVMQLVQTHRLRLLTFEPLSQTIVRWNP